MHEPTPNGILVLRCGFIPRLLGVLLMLAGAGYLFWGARGSRAADPAAA